MSEEIPLISVIVPIYNVDKYVRKCLDSLKEQTLKQIEVICIDDGSTDDSGRIAEEYVSVEWPVFRIIHTENKGLSAARNRGIDEARANWIMFVDSDDWVDKDFCRIPYEAAIENQADLIIFEYFGVTKFGTVKRLNKSSPHTGSIDEMTAHEFGGVAAWNKLYRASLFENIRYPEGHVYEDLATTHKIIHLAERMVRIQDRLYYHIFRRRSISHIHTGKQSRDSFMSNLERYNELKEWGYPEGKLKPILCSSALGLLAYAQDSKDWLHKKAEEVINSTDRFPNTYPILKKIALKVWKIDKRLFFFCSKLVVMIRR